MKHCLGCFNELNEGINVCPYCGYVEGFYLENNLHLAPGTMLSGRYTVGKVISSDGMSVTYAAWDNNSNIKVNIREFFPDGYVTRSSSSVIPLNEECKTYFEAGFSIFVEEAKQLFGGNGNVKLYDCIAENNTAYMILESKNIVAPTPNAYAQTAAVNKTPAVKSKGLPLWAKILIPSAAGLIVIGTGLTVLFTSGILKHKEETEESEETSEVVETTKGITVDIEVMDYQEHSYGCYGDADSWEAAKEYCEQLGGHLVVINSAKENEAVWNYVNSKGYESVYLGLSDTEEEGNWKWVNGDPVEYTNWKEGEPNAYTDAENYAEYAFDVEGGYWNDFRYDTHAGVDEIHYVCEWDFEVTGSSNISYEELQETLPSPTPTATPTPTPIPDINIDEDHFPDPEFRRYVSEDFDTDGNGMLSQDEILVVHDFYFCEIGEDGPIGTEVESYKGIEYFTELRTMKIYLEYDLIDLDISKNMKLKNVDFMEMYNAGNDSNEGMVITMRSGQSITLAYYESDAKGYIGNQDEPYVTTDNTDVLSIYFPRTYSLRTRITGRTPGEADITGRFNCTFKVVEKDNSVSVTDAVSETFTVDMSDDVCWDCEYRIPQVNIKGKDMSAVNNKIASDLSQYPYTGDVVWGDDQKDVFSSEIYYATYIDDKMISICVYVDENLFFIREGVHFFIYNVSIETGDFMSNSEVVNLYGLTDEEFFDEAYTILDRFDRDNASNNRGDTDESIKEWLDADNLNEMNYDRIHPYISPDGHLCFEMGVSFTSSPNFGYYRFNVNEHTCCMNYWYNETPPQ